MSEQAHRSRPDTIIGPAKWFAAGGITIGAAVGLVFAFLSASPRTLTPMPLMNTETVALEPNAAGSNVALVEPQPLTTTAAGPVRPLSGATEALLVPRGTMPTPLVATPTKPAEASPATPSPPGVDEPSKVDPATPAVPATVAPATPKPATAPQPKPAPKPQSPAIAGGTININTASASELELLPQIGPALAARIIDYRTTHGPFRQLADLDKVKGIGPKTLDKLKSLVRFE